MDKFLYLMHRILRGVANRTLDKNFVNPRSFINKMTKEYAPYFSGSLINVSGWDDNDGRGGNYQSYFKNVSDYTISNMPNVDKGFGSTKNNLKEIELDLSKKLPDEYYKKYDITFCVNTLEHIKNPELGFKNLCDLSKDVAIITLPVCQQIHITETYGDYWRMTTLGMAEHYRINGFEPIIIQVNDQPFAPIYGFGIGVRNYDKYRDKIKKNINFEMGARLYGSSLKEKHKKMLNDKFVNN